MDEAKTSDSAVATTATAQPFQAPALDGSAAAAAGTGSDVRPNIDVILDVPVGRLLRLSQGSVVELDRSAGEPLDVLVNGTLVAHGEIVIVNDKFGIRLTDVVPPAKRTGSQD
jgi:flagellar motor switch protein FliN/FliY